MLVLVVLSLLVVAMLVVGHRVEHRHAGRDCWRRARLVLAGVGLSFYYVSISRCFGGAR
jgi:uncharacterized membrane protein